MSNKYFKDLDVNFVNDNDTYADLVVEPFERGYAVTIGNALRRTLLTALPGAAITSIKIDGVPHEFSTIKGVSDDTSDIILNLKKVRFKMLNEDANSELINFEISGPSTFEAGELNNYLTDFEVINSKEKVLEITSKTKLNVEMRISRGKGYLSSDLNKRPDDSVGTISIDSIFNPITNVSWEVQPIAASTEEQEKLLIQVTSDGSTTPRDAINHAAKIMNQHVSYFMFDDANAIKAVNSDELNEALEVKSILLKSIDEMELSVRSHNCLQAAGIETIGELVSKEESEMLKYKNFGRKSLTELGEKLDQLGLKFGMDISNYIEE